jgi:hypothetical protein
VLILVGCSPGTLGGEPCGRKKVPPAVKWDRFSGWDGNWNVQECMMGSGSVDLDLSLNGD